MRADEAELLHRSFQVAQSLHTFGRIDARQPAKPIGILRDGLGDPLVGHVPGAGSALLSHLARHQECPLDAGGIHLRQHLLQRDGLDVGRRAPDFPGVEFPCPRGTRRHDTWRERVDDDIDGPCSHVSRCSILALAQANHPVV